MLTIPLLINGKEVHTSRILDISSPSSGQVLHKASCATSTEIDQAISAAKAAFPAWSKTSPYERRDVFLKAASIFESRIEEFVQYEMDEIAATQFFAGSFDAPTAINGLKDLAGRIVSLSGSLPQLGGDRGAVVVKEPYGVVLGIAPWYLLLIPKLMVQILILDIRNAGYILGFRAISYAIAAGNTAILKGSETCPRVTHSIGKIFTEAGLPPGVLNIITAHPEDASDITTQLIASPAIKKVNFTGSTNVGRIIAKLCGEHIKPCLMELGGKAPAIVLEDADLKLAAKEIALGAFLNSGQICMATERVIVHKSISKEFIDVFRETTKQIWPESHVLISKASWEKNKKLLDDAKKKGVEVLFGDQDASGDGQLRLFPIALKGVTKEMDIYYTESFGPSVAVLEVETDEEALEIANDTEYGLSSALFTKDLARGLKIASAIESGAVHINSMSVHDEPNLPHGGTKSSGFGRFGAQGLEEWVRTKTITFPKW